MAPTIRKRILPTAAVGATLLPISVLAHHALDEVYERDSSITLTGTVTRTDWVNPHTSFRLSVTDATGTVVEWLVELDPPHALSRRGWIERPVVAGQIVTVEGFLALDGGRQTYAKTVTLPLPSGETLIASTDASWMWRTVRVF